jgi:hypothetical protein
MSTLFSPLQLGSLELPNRIIMAPLTRSRASKGRVPNDLMREYYVQRASAWFDFYRGHGCDANGRRLCGHARHLVERTNRRVGRKLPMLCTRRADAFSLTVACRAPVAPLIS